MGGAYRNTDGLAGFGAPHSTKNFYTDRVPKWVWLQVAVTSRAVTSRAVASVFCCSFTFASLQGRPHLLADPYVDVTTFPW